MTLLKRIFGDSEGMGCLVLTGSLLPLAPACGGIVGETASNENAGTPNSVVAVETSGSGGEFVWSSGGGAGTNSAGVTETTITAATSSGGTSSGSGSGGNASTNLGWSSTGGTFDTSDSASGGEGYGTSGSGSGTLAGYSSCSWDAAEAVASLCGNPTPSPDYHGIVLTLAYAGSPQEYTLVVELTPEFYL